MFMTRPFKSSQRGVTLFLALVVLVAMLLSGIALFRTVDSGILVAGNIAMQKSATRQGDQGTEAAVAWLTANAGTAVVHANVAAEGYVANAANDSPAVDQTWVTWWAAYTATHAPKSLAEDPATGNTVSYLIQRLCTAAGAPHTGGVSCSGPPKTSGTGGKGVNTVALNRPTEVYYRITSRIAGPRNTVSFIQTVISL